MNELIRIVALLVVCTPFSLHAEIYRWVDEHGRVHFTDRPQDGAPARNVESLSGRAPAMAPASTAKADLSESEDPDPFLNYQHPLTSETLRIRRLFEAEQFEQLNHVLAESLRMIQGNIDAEMQHREIYRAFEGQGPMWDELFDRWITQYPGQYQGYLARATYLSYRGWKARGGAFINETPRENLAQMVAFMSRAQRDLVRTLDIESGALWAYCLRISIAMASGDSDEASRALAQAIQRYPATYLVRNYYLSTLDPKWGGSKASMLGFANHAQRHARSNPRLRLLLSQVNYEAGRMAYVNEDYPQALELLSAAIDQGTHPLAYFVRGKAYARLGDHEKALTDFNEVINRGREDADYYYSRTRTFMALKRYGEALIDIQRAYALSPDNEAISRLRQRLIGYAKTPPIAPAQQVAGGSKEAESLFSQAMVLIENNQFGQAKEILDRAIRLQPDEFRYYQLIDHALFKQGNLREILGYWDAYLAIKPGDGRAYLERAGTYYHLQDFDAAMIDTKRAIALGNERARGLYLRLESTSRQ